MANKGKGTINIRVSNSFFTAPSLPSEQALNRIKKFGVRVVGDVHGDMHSFEHALATERYIIQLGDLVDYGDDNVGVLQKMLGLLENDRGMFVLGNHDRKLGRALEGRKLHRDPEHEATVKQLVTYEDTDLKYRVLIALQNAPIWQRIESTFFIHGGFHTQMLNTTQHNGLHEMNTPLARALFGEVTNQVQEDGYPKRRLNWVHRIPNGITVYVGHDQRSQDGRPWEKVGKLGGKAVFMDLGAAKGGHLAWRDLDEF